MDYMNYEQSYEYDYANNTDIELNQSINSLESNNFNRHEQLEEVETTQELEYTQSLYDKECQSNKQEPLRRMRCASRLPMNTLKANLFKRRQIAYDGDRRRLRQLMKRINVNPPPWKDASELWLEVDVVERQIEEFENDMAEMQMEYE
ncbi:uncharacterized protein LOC108605443 [Drosophila busckii]|uniref:uncharacterized protein LOC108605443 n=1 Tax=Drosophila busckii TaxID=30019 RepID=UPI00083EE67B|nr:uncharacterized protein LOC108605443 [Drosophila busckii]